MHGSRSETDTALPGAPGLSRDMMNPVPVLHPGVGWGAGGQVHAAYGPAVPRFGEGAASGADTEDALHSAHGDAAVPTLLVLSPCQGHLPPHCGTWHSPGTKTIHCQAQHPGPDADGHTWEQGGLQRAANTAVVLSPLSIAAGAPMDTGGQRHQMMTAMSPSSHSCWTTGVFHPTAWG